MFDFFRKKTVKSEKEIPAEVTSFYRLDEISMGSKKIVFVTAVFWSLFQIYTAFTGTFSELIQRSITLCFALVLSFLCYGLKKRDKNRIPIYDIGLILLSIICVVYIWINFEDLNFRAGKPLFLDVVLGVALIILVVEATRRTVGLPLMFVACFFLFYAYFGYLFPGLLGHKGYSVSRIATHMYFTLEGIFGIPMSVMTTYVFAFILFGAVLEATGGAKLFIDLSYALAGKSRGGPAKTAVIASGLMGTVSGSSLANVVTTGTFTIPLMKKVGYKPSFAGGVEAAASSGGQLMPPVMGAAAFVMAEMTGIPYLTICKAAAIPAILYFFSIYVMVDLEARRLQLKPTPPEFLPNLFVSLRKGVPLIVPVVTIIWLLVVGYTPLKAALYASFLMLVTSSFNKETRLTPAKFFKCLEMAALNSVAVCAACAVCGIITGVVTLTGIGLKLAYIILVISGGKLLPTLVLTMIASILLGMGLPTTAKYIVLSVIAAPALVKIGVPLITSHLFILYYGIVAEVTPPVALTSYAGAAVAKAPGMETAFKGLKLSAAGFLLPFVFVYSPELLMIDPTPVTLVLALTTAVIGVICLGVSMGGYLFIKCSYIERFATFIAAICLLFAGIITDIVGLGFLVITLLSQAIRKKKLDVELIMKKKFDVETLDQIISNKKG